MQGTKSPYDQEEDRMSTQPLSFTAQTFSDLELKNQKFKRIAWAAAFLLLGVVTVLILQLVGVIKY
jgi:ABC-type phosphate transport system permease subunit